MEYRNAKYVSLAGDVIDCEINHPVYGWIPYTIDPADTDQTIDNDALLAAIEKAGDVAAYVAPDPVEALTAFRASASMPRKQWALISAQQGWITEAEALAWVGGTAIPAWVDRVIDTHIPAEQRLKTKLAVLDSQVIYRIGGLMPFLQAEQGVTDEELDAYFGWTD